MSQDAQLNVTPAFAAPLVDTRHPDPEPLNRALRELFLAREGPESEPDPPIPTGKHNVFESEFSLFAWRDDCVQALKRFVVGSLIRVVQNLNGYDDDRMRRLRVSNHSWFHITRTGGYASVHNHPMAAWSSVYCVSPGDDEGAENPDNGVLRFLDARPAASMYLDPGNMHLRRPYGHGSINYRLKSGQLIIFPSHLMHEVAPYHGRSERITVASNFWFRAD